MHDSEPGLSHTGNAQLLGWNRGPKEKFQFKTPSASSVSSRKRLQQV